MQRCKSERSSCAKVEKWDQRTEYGVQSTECGKIAVQRWKAAFGLWKGAKMKRQLKRGGRGAESWRGGAASELSNRQTLTAIRLGQHVVLSLPYASQKRQIMTMAAVSSWQ